jgi:hypothetical protein
MVEYRHSAEQMDLEILKTFGGIAGLAGLAVGLILLLYREIIRKNVFPTLTKKHAYLLLRTIAVLSWSVAIVGILCWAWSNSNAHRSQSTNAVADSVSQEIPVVAGTIVDQVTNLGIGQATIAIDGESSTYTSDDTGNFRILLPAKHFDRVRLSVTKNGYRQADQLVTPPTHDLILQMRPR